MSLVISPCGQVGQCSAFSSDFWVERCFQVGDHRGCDGLVTDHGALYSYELSGDSSASTALGPDEQKPGWVQIKPSTLPLVSSSWDTAQSCYQMWILDTLPSTELLTDAADSTDKESNPLTPWF